ncbi:Zinc finger MYM-type protein 1-like [Oopsacas minuta]|uniref:Zinc finger MYM-type protein 1-like n=1 Tax=Oopsacas minuta TaxID=111878 RepID=A0AAV7JF42_9METZ|nr:Zinc finger MYM-type protein 1-like [Oopsacas minuta]
MYLKRTTNFISPRGQEEMMEIFSHCIVREVVSDIQKHGCFAIIVDGTQDVSGREQESICLRHVNSDLHVREDFVGIYEIPITTSESIAGMVFDVLTRFTLPLSNLRAQTYDGAANMSGHYTGCQARVRQCQPLALYFHCASHISNLVMQNAVISSQLVRNALQWTNKLGVLMNRSGKYRAMFRAICVSNESESLHPSAIKPLCRNAGTVKISTESIRAWYSDEVFHEIFIAAEEKGETYQLDPLEIPRRRCHSGTKWLKPGSRY